MNINNLNTYSKPSFSLAAMCLAQIGNSASDSCQQDEKTKKANINSPYKDRKGNGVGIRGVAEVERIGQGKVSDIFKSVKFDLVKAYKIIDAHKARMAIIRNK